MWYTYIIYSKNIDRYYVGYTDDLEWRLERHNQGWGRYTKRGIPWELVYDEKYKTKSEAITREQDIKRKNSRSYIEKLISHAGACPP